MKVSEADLTAERNAVIRKQKRAAEDYTAQAADTQADYSVAKRKLTEALRSSHRQLEGELNKQKIDTSSIAEHERNESTASETAQKAEMNQEYQRKLAKLKTKLKRSQEDEGTALAALK